MKRNTLDLLNEKQMDFFEKYKTYNTAYEYDLINAIASNPTYANSKYVTCATYISQSLKEYFWDVSWYDVIKEHVFETINIPVPEKYDMHLKSEYGNYLTLPPIENRGNWHEGVLWDPDKPYMCYIEKMKH